MVDPALPASCASRDEPAGSDRLPGIQQRACAELGLPACRSSRVSGSGKTTIGRALATRLGWSFEEGDALHPPENIAKMRAGQPLTDADRAPWLSAIAARIDEWRRRSESGVITCSALKRSYRQVI